jgi:hypothetical protein
MAIFRMSRLAVAIPNKVIMSHSVSDVMLDDVITDNDRASGRRTEGRRKEGEMQLQS